MKGSVLELFSLILEIDIRSFFLKFWRVTLQIAYLCHDRGIRIRINPMVTNVTILGDKGSM